jgi:ATP-dependent DNA helicase RecG
MKLIKKRKRVWVAKSIDKTEINYETFMAKSKKFLEKRKVFVINRKMNNESEILKEFDACNSAVLFSTTVIEVGIDIDVKCIVIEDADQFGLAQLHQIRGRVGRRKEDGECILIGENTTYLEKIKNTVTGEQISEMDLGKRGYGVLHSNLQSGFDHFIFSKQ